MAELSLTGLDGFRHALEIAPCISSIPAIPGGHAGMTVVRDSSTVTPANDCMDAGVRATHGAVAEDARAENNARLQATYRDVGS